MEPGDREIKHWKTSQKCDQPLPAHVNTWSSGLVYTYSTEVAQVLWCSCAAVVLNGRCYLQQWESFPISTDIPPPQKVVAMSIGEGLSSTQHCLHQELGHNCVAQGCGFIDISCSEDQGSGMRTCTVLTCCLGFSDLLCSDSLTMVLIGAGQKQLIFHEKF